MSDVTKKTPGRTKNKIVASGGKLYSMPAPHFRIFLAERSSGNNPKIANYGTDLGSVDVDVTTLSAEQAATLLAQADAAE